MNKQAVEEELNEIFNLFKACIDKDHLVKLCEQKGLIVNASILKEAEEHQNKFASVFSNLVSVGASDSLLLETITAFNKSFDKEGKHVRPKTDPTQDAVQKRMLDKKVRQIQKDDGEKKERKRKAPTGLGKIWDRAFLIEMSKRYGEWDKEKQWFVNKDGEPLIKITGYSGIQDYVESQVATKIRVLPRGWNEEDFSEGILAYMFYPGSVDSGRKSFYDEVDGLLEKAKNQNKLPLEIAGLLKDVAKRRTFDFITKNINQQFADEVAVHDQEDYISGLKKKLENAKTDEAKKTIENSIEKAKSRLNGLQEALNTHSAPLEYEQGTIKKHPYVNEEISPSGERIPFSEDNVDMVADAKELIADLIEKEDLQKHFGTFLKAKADDKTYKVYNYLIKNDSITVENRKELSEDLEISTKEIGIIAGKLKNYIAQYAYENDDELLLAALEQRDLLPAKYRIKKKSSFSLIEDRISSLESQVYRTLGGDDDQKNILLSSIQELSSLIKPRVESESVSKVGKIVEYLEVLSQKL